MRIAFLIRSLACGGAERQLVLLARGLAAVGHDVSVSVFYPEGEFIRDLSDSGVRVHILEKRSRWDIVRFLRRTHLVLRAENPEVIHAYLGGANLVTGVLKHWLKPAKIVWGIRASTLDRRDYDWLHTVSNRLEALFSCTADLVIANSEAGRRHVVSLGYPSDRTVVVPNGINLKQFDIDPVARMQIRREWRLSNDDIAVGRAGRLDPVKDYPGFLRAAAMALRAEPRLKFVCIGTGSEARAAALRSYAAELGLENRVIWTGFIRDMQAAYNGLDLFVSSSKSEGFPNVLLEAMACGVPCVATDVGDVRLVVREYGRVVPHGDTEALASALVEVAGRKPERKAIRQCVHERYSVELLVERTLAQLRRVLPEGRSDSSRAVPIQSAVAGG